MQHVRTSKVVPKIRQLARIARELREGASFNITRLTTLKSLCGDATAAARFAMHLAQLTYRRMRDRACPAHLDPEQWEYSLQVVDESLRQMQRYLENPRRKTLILCGRDCLTSGNCTTAMSTRCGDRYGASTARRCC
jgi:hypothetical protein